MLGAMSEQAGARAFKIPQSVLVVIHTSGLEVLLIERADKPGYWQSVTGSKDRDDERAGARDVGAIIERGARPLRVGYLLRALTARRAGDMLGVVPNTRPMSVFLLVSHMRFSLYPSGFATK